MAKELTDEQVNLLTCLSYLSYSADDPVLGDEIYDKLLSGEYENRNMTLGDILEKMEIDNRIAELRAKGNTEDKTHITGNEWADVLEAINNDPDLRNLVLADIDSNKEAGNMAFCLTSDTQTYVIFKGTGSDGVLSEWLDNVRGFYMSDTPAQIAAANYANYCYKRFGGEIVVGGHSKGANKAMYATVLFDFVTRCVVIDGQGFSPEFFRVHGDEIEQRACRITAYNRDGDFISPLLMSIAGNTIYVKGRELEPEGFLRNHVPHVIFDENMELIKTDRTDYSATIEAFTTYMETHISVSEREELGESLGPILDIIMGGSEGNIFDHNPEKLFIVFKYLKYYTLYLIDQNTPTIFNIILYAVPGYFEATSKPRVIIRDFSDEKHQELLSIITEAEADPWVDASRWDVKYSDQPWYNKSEIGCYQNALANHLKSTASLYKTSKKEITKIFRKAREKDAAFSNIMKTRSDSLIGVRKKLESVYK
jgi:hypothetical protein